MAKTIFITGASKGFGRVWAEAALKRGDKVAGTARNLDDIKDLAAKYKDTFLPLQLDVNDRQMCFDTVKKAHDHFKNIDVLISNAGYGHFGMVEEVTEAEARKQIETNVFGSLWIIQAVLPIMRKQQSGHILQVSSIGGVIAFPTLGIYHASKWAVEGMCEALSQEVQMFGIKVTLVEPGGYSTDWGSASASQSNQIEAYKPLADGVRAMMSGVKLGNPEATAKAILKIIDSKDAPLRILLGDSSFNFVQPKYEERVNTWKEWLQTSVEAQG